VRRLSGGKRVPSDEEGSEGRRKKPRGGGGTSRRFLPPLQVSSFEVKVCSEHNPNTGGGKKKKIPGKVGGTLRQIQGRGGAIVRFAS